MTRIEDMRGSRFGLRTLTHRQRRPTREEFLEQKESARTVYHRLESLHGNQLLQSEPVKKLLAYVTDWEPFITNRNPQVTMDMPGIFPNRENGSLALPYPFITPSTKESSQWPDKHFYWDIYFINKGLIATKDPAMLEIAKGHIENFQYLFDRLEVIPNASDVSLLNRSQIPFLTGMIRDIYKETGDKQWLEEKMIFAKKEYDEWMMTKKQLEQRGSPRPSHRVSEDSVLLRASGRDLAMHYEAAAETGQDDSTEWAGRAHEYIPITLNCALYKYESDLAWSADILGKPVEKSEWEAKAERRKTEINAVLWDSKKGRYVNAALNRRTKEWERDVAYHGLSSFMPLWVGLADGNKASATIAHLPKFETPYGLVIATKPDFPRLVSMRRKLGIAFFPKRERPAVMDLSAHKQWDYPNIWAPMEYFAVDGLMRYKKNDDAQRVLENSLRGMAAFYAEHGTLPEKLNGLTGQNGKDYMYPNQEGFGWHNAWALLAAERLIGIEKGKNVYATIS